MKKGRSEEGNALQNPYCGGSVCLRVRGEDEIGGFSCGEWGE